MTPAAENTTFIQSYKKERLFHRHSNLINNRVYSCYIPRVIIGISILYLCMLLIVCIIKGYRRHRERQEKREKERIKATWQRSILKFHSRKRQTQEETSFITRPDNIHSTNCYCPSSSSSLTLNSSHTNNNTMFYSHYIKQKFSPTTIDLPSTQTSKHKKRNLSRSKRLNLLWQWGSSMGYCEYSHAKKLNAFIIELQQKYECHRTVNDDVTRVEVQ